MNRASASDFASWTDSEVQSLRQAAQRLQAWTLRQGTLGTLLGACAALALSLVQPYAALGLAAGIALGCAAACFLLNWLHGTACAVEKRLRPLRESANACETALDLLCCPACLAHRDAVVGAGRELVAQDLLHMQTLAQGWQFERQLAHAQLLHRKLHGP